ncbi:MAG: signal peptidase I [Spirochaetaceae bacterium]|jgi:signal peptidase I|nr:signal peptidase I [Spirochaetaceae bacterium]
MAKTRKFSTFKEQKYKRHQIRWILLGFLVFYVLYSFFTEFILSTWVLENDTMQPNLRSGDRFICSSYTFFRLLPDFSWLNAAPPLRRGNVVVVDMALKEPPGLAKSLLDGGARFFTFQRLSFGDRGGQAYMKRVIGLPGDEITMINYVFRVKPRDGTYSFTEFELWEKPYDVTIPGQAPALWDGSLPFSGNIEPFILGDGECFVVSDDRSNTNDSRTWGPVPLDYVVGKALFRYWPVTRLGAP